MSRKEIQPREPFLNHFNLTEQDMCFLWELFLQHGMTRGEGHERSTGNHYFLQGIVQYHSVEWKSWGKKCTPHVRKIIETKYPQLMVQNKTFER